MNYLEICQKVRSISGIHGSMDTTVNASGIYGVIANLVNDAWAYVQSYRKDWGFMVAPSSFTTIPGQQFYTQSEVLSGAEPGLAAGSYIKDKLFLDRDLRPLAYIKYLNTLNHPNFLSGDTGTPVHWSCVPDTLDMILLPTPDAQFIMDLFFHLRSQIFSADGDVPGFAAQHHDLIVYKSLELFSVYIGNQELYQKYNTEFLKALNTLMRFYVPHKKANLRGGFV